MNSAPYRAATAFIAKEMDMANTDMPDPSDMALVESWFIPWSSPSLKAQNIQKILHGLAFRWLAQERILMIAEDLISQGLVNIESLYKPMALASNQDYSDSVKTVYKVLLSFTLGSDCLDRFRVPGNHDPGRPFMSALRWLSVLVCRSCTDWKLVVSRWVGFQLPGKPICSDSDLLPRKHEDRCIHTNPDEAVESAAADKPYTLPQLGFWLPNGVPVQEFVRPWIDRSNELRGVYESTTGNSWPGHPDVEEAVARLLAMETGQLPN